MPCFALHCLARLVLTLQQSVYEGAAASLQTLSAVQCSAVQCSAVQAVQAVQCSAVQCSGVGGEGFAAPCSCMGTDAHSRA